MSRHSYCKRCSRCTNCESIGELIRELCRNCREFERVTNFKEALKVYARDPTKKGQLARDVLRRFKYMEYDD